MKIQSPLLHLTLYALHLTPYTITFIKIVASFTSLIPCLVLPRELRETTEGTPKEDHMTKKALFLRLSPKKVVLIPEKVISLPKKVDSFPETVDLYSSPLHLTLYTLHQKNRTKMRFFLLNSKKSITFASQLLILI